MSSNIKLGLFPWGVDMDHEDKAKHQPTVDTPTAGSSFTLHPSGKMPVGDPRLSSRTHLDRVPLGPVPRVETRGTVGSLDTVVK